MRTRHCPGPTKKVVTVAPTTTSQYWNKQNKELKEQSANRTPKPTPKPVWWTPVPSPKPTYAPTEDQCRGAPCDRRNECRSRLGFCGTGIVYCNSASSWVSKCGGANNVIQMITSPNPVASPTETPSSHWEGWASNKDEGVITSDVNNTEDADNVVADGKGEEEQPMAGFNPNAWATDNWQSREITSPNDGEKKDYRWWMMPNSARRQARSWSKTAFLCVSTFLFATLLPG